MYQSAYLHAMAMQSSRKAEALLVILDPLECDEEKPPQLAVADASVVVEDVAGDGGYFHRRDVLEFSVTAAAQDDRRSPGQVKGLYGAGCFLR